MSHSNVHVRVAPRDMSRFRLSMAQLKEQHPDVKEPELFKLAAQSVWPKAAGGRMRVRMRARGLVDNPRSRPEWFDTKSVSPTKATRAMPSQDKGYGETSRNRKMGRGQLPWVKQGGCKGCTGGKCGCGIDSNMEGDGWLSDKAKAAKDWALGHAGKIATTLAAWVAPASMPSKVKAKMNELKDYVITDIKVCRIPIIGLVEKFIRLVAKTQPQYDKLYHLYMVIGLKNAAGDVKKIRMERNQTFELNWAKDSDSSPPHHEVPEGVTGSACVPVKLKNQTTPLTAAMDGFIKEAEARNPTMGAWRYAATGKDQNNCQDMVTSFIKALGDLTPSLSSFINQKVENLLSSNIEKAGQAVTDIAGAAGNLLFGGKKKRRNIRGGERVATGGRGAFPRARGRNDDTTKPTDFEDRGPAKRMKRGPLRSGQKHKREPTWTVPHGQQGMGQADDQGVPRAEAPSVPYGQQGGRKHHIRGLGGVLI